MVFHCFCFYFFSGSTIAHCFVAECGKEIGYSAMWWELFCPPGDLVGERRKTKTWFMLALIIVRCGQALVHGFLVAHEFQF